MFSVATRFMELLEMRNIPAVTNYTVYTIVLCTIQFFSV